MVHYKLTYFNFRGRGEIVRLVFAAADVEFEDNRVEREQWPSLKPSTPFGQMPVLEVDGVKLCQSNSIARYLAREFGLAGKTALDQARADMLVDCFEDTVKPMLGFWFESDETIKAEKKRKYLEEQLPVSLDNLEKLLEENEGGKGYFVGDSLTWADLAFLVTVDWLQTAGVDEPVVKRPKLHAVLERVKKEPKIAAWIAKRPKSDM